MTRLSALLALLLVASACDSTVEAPALAQVSVGAKYSAATFRVTEAKTGTPLLDLLAIGAEMDIEFESARRFTGRLFVPRSALIATGETDDVDRDADWVVSGSYTQRDGVLTFIVDREPFADTFLDAGGWTISPDGRSIRFDDVDDDVRVEVVLKRR